MSAWWASLHFLRPHWLWALAALPLLAWWWRARRARANIWRERVDAHLLPHLLVAGGRGRSAGPIAALLGYALAVLALAGPSWRMETQPLWQSRTPLVVVLDMSSRITASDLPPSRLLQARAKLAQLLDARSGGQAALVVYAEDAFTVAPLTADVANIRLYLDELSPGIMPADGQRADRGIAWAARLLKQAGFEQGDILLMSDRADAAARSAATAAQGQGYRVSAMGLGTAGGAAYRDGAGTIAHAALDATSLQRLAAAGGGDYAALTADAADLSRLGLLLPEDAAAVTGQAAGKAWRDEGYWLLLPVLLLGLLAFRRGGVAAALALCVLLPFAMPVRAAGIDWWQRADQRQHARIEQGAQAYRQGDYAAAQQAFTGIGTAEGWYNLGNALAKQQRYDEAIRAYDQALEQQPGMEDAVANRAAVEAARKRPPSGGQGDQGKPDAGAPQGKGQPSGSPQQGAQGQQNAQNQPGMPSPSSQQRQSNAARAPTPPPSPEPSSSDPARQREADAAQRERMRQAMAQQARPDAAGTPPGKTAVQAETAEQRERRQAVDAWLRRVPDEPGSLLKAKFRLEHERRQREGR